MGQAKSDSFGFNHHLLFMKRVVLVLLVCVAFFTKTEAQQIPQGPAGQYVVVNGHRIWVHIFGKGEPLLFIPGGPGAAHHFWPDMNVFSDRYRVIYYDPYGRGKSDRAKDPSEYTFVRDVEEVEGLRLALGLGKWNVYGKSYGTMVAQAYVLKYPNSVSHLILGAPFHSGEMWQKGNNDNSNYQIKTQYPEVGQRLDSLRRLGYVSTDSIYMAAGAVVNDGLLYYFNPSNNALENFDINFEVYKQLTGNNGDVVLSGDVAGLDFRGRLKEIKVPTLIIAGRFDRVSTPEYAMQYKWLMPQAKFVLFERSGHHPSIEEPGLHTKVVLEFLNGN